MQIAPVLSYAMPYVARPIESGSVTSPASSTRPTDAAPSAPIHTAGAQPTSAERASGVRAPNAAESASQAEGNEASTARADEASGNKVTPQRDDGKQDTGKEERQTASASADTAAPKGPDGQPLSPEDVRLLKDMQARDREVRQHELAHQIVGGQFAGGASYTFERGPDGGRYAVAGEVPIDVGPIPGDPQATIEKMRKVRAAALAPAEPSAQDRAIAAKAAQTMMAAQLELSLQRSDGAGSENGATASAITAKGAEKPSSTEAESTRAIEAYTEMMPAMVSARPGDTPRIVA